MAESIVLNLWGNPDVLAKDIADKFDKWKSYKAPVEQEWKKTREYIFANSTKDTQNKKLPYKNTTTTPKLCQLYEQLYTLTYNIKFAANNFIEFVSSSQDESDKAKRDVMNSYMKKIIEDSGFHATALELDADLYLYGNAFAKVEFERNMQIDSKFNQEEIKSGFVGARLVRISPFDIVFNPTATSFSRTPKIVRKIVDMGQLKKQLASQPDLYDLDVWKKIVDVRRSFKGYSYKDQCKDAGFRMDGYGSLRDYMNSGTVEVLEFYGDIYIEDTDELLENRTIMVVDRRFVLLNKANDRELGEGLIFHNGDRKTPDNLWHKSRLSNLLGMQFQVDKFNNGKADGIDLITNPPIVEYGDVEPYQWRPGARIKADSDGKVQQMPVDTKFLQANFEVSNIMQLMETFAGLPAQAMGFKTKGEKTLGEVHALENATLRQFNVRIQSQENKFWQPIFNCMFAQSRANLLTTELIKIIGQSNTEIFKTITKEDISANGNFKAIGSSRFDKMMKLERYLQTILNSNMMQDPSTRPHISGLKLIEQFGELTGLDSKGVIGENIGLQEEVDVELYRVQLQQQTQKIMSQMQLPTQDEVDIAQIAQDEKTALDGEVVSAALNGGMNVQ